VRNVPVPVLGGAAFAPSEGTSGTLLAQTVPKNKEIRVWGA